jgi:tRNA pseudouridine55 synthase
LLSPEEQLRDGIAIVDKPAGWTSHDVVAKARGLLHNKKIGHSGTLDPDATGVLLLGIGRVTRLLRFLMVLPKTYTGQFVLGVETSTLDAAGDIVATHDMAHVTEAHVRAAAVHLTGDIMQIPPMVSAVRVGGKRLHELARAGEVVERDPRPVTVHRFDVAAVDEAAGRYEFLVTCSSGTYVRSLAADLGHALDGGAHLTGLRRTSIGSFSVDEARPLDDLVVLPPIEAVRDYASVVVDDDAARDVGHGKVLPRARLGLDGEGPWALRDGGNRLLAMYESHRGELVKPAVVLEAARPGSSANG